MKLTAEQKKQRALNLYEVLLTVKEKCDNGDFNNRKNSVRIFLNNNGFKGGIYATAINNLNITYYDEFYIQRWKENIPVSHKLVSTIFKEVFRLRDAYQNNSAKIKQVKPVKLALPIVDKTKIEKFSKGSKRVGAGRKPLQKNLQKVGLIRRFLRWIY
jgi:hypothetical protein